jgi:TPR repeat protein
MVVVGSLYAAGVKPDPDNKLEFMWFKRAADQSNPQGARRVAMAYLDGRGVAKDMTDAVKWAAISESLGGGSFEIQNIEPKATVAQHELGRQRAAAWLAARQ